MMALPKTHEDEEYLGNSRSLTSPALIEISGSRKMTGRLGWLAERAANLDLVPSCGLANWFSETAREVASLMVLHTDWDSYGGEPLDPLTAEAALRLLVRIAEPTLSRPKVFPESAGGVGFEFQTKTSELTVIVHRHGDISHYYEDRVRGLEHEGQGVPIELNEFRNS